MSAMMALFYLRLRKVGTEFSHETAASDEEKLFKFEQVVHVHRMELQSRTRTSLMTLQRRAV